MKSYSMRSSLLITIVIMGLLCVGLTLFTGEIYLQQTLDNREETFSELAELEVHNLWDKLKEETKSLGLSVQSSTDFRKAVKNNIIPDAEKALNDHFHRAYVTLGILNLTKLIVYDKDFNKRFQSSEGEVVNDDVCPLIIKNARKRTGVSRFKTIHQVCNYGEELRLVTIVPVGGLRLKGYLLVVIDPLNNLTQAEEGLGIPVMIKNSVEGLLFKSDNWPDSNSMNNTMLVHYSNRAGNKKPVAHFYFASDVTDLKENLFRTRLGLISFVVMATLIAMVVALGLFRQTIIKPLDTINSYLHKVRSNKKYLNDELKVSGSKELVSLADEMNTMSFELSRLYNEFEEMAFTDSLTGIPNRALLFDRLEQITQFAKRDKAQSEFMLMMLDLNKFKAVNDELGHHVGDLLLVAVAERLQSALRTSDTVARIGGDEFSIILYAVKDRDVAVSVADKITALMNELFVIEGHQLDVGMSIGIARFPHDGNNSEEIMHSADMAMYHAKRNKMPYIFFDGISG